MADELTDAPRAAWSPETSAERRQELGMPPRPDLSAWLRSLCERDGSEYVPLSEEQRAAVATQLRAHALTLPASRYVEKHQAADSEDFFRELNVYKKLGRRDWLRDLLCNEVEGNLLEVFEHIGAEEIAVDVCMGADWPAQTEKRHRLERPWYTEPIIERERFSDAIKCLVGVANGAVEHDRFLRGLGALMSAGPGAPDRDDRALRVESMSCLTDEQFAFVRAVQPRDDEHPHSPAEHMRLHRLRRKVRRNYEELSG
jgi:hypothetical protein